MFPDLQLEVMDRFTAVKQYFRKSPTRPSDIGQTAKGLVFVQVYGIYEYTARAVTRLTIAEIASAGHKMLELRPSLMALFLDAEIKSRRAVGDAKQWEHRIALFEKTFSNDSLTAVQVMPHDGSHYRHSHLQLIFDILGIERSIMLRKRHPNRLDEVVHNRNQIAHGEEAAADVGRRYTRREINQRIRFMEKLCIRLIFLASNHCSRPAGHRR